MIYIRVVVVEGEEMDFSSWGGTGKSNTALLMEKCNAGRDLRTTGTVDQVLELANKVGVRVQKLAEPRFLVLIHGIRHEITSSVLSSCCGRQMFNGISQGVPWLCSKQSP